MSEVLPTTYYSESKKEDLLIAEMNPHHLKSTTLKEERMNPGAPLTRALRVELDKRDAAFAAEQEAAGIAEAHAQATAHRRD